jgi:5-methylcytosine-specific restriction protein A
MIGEMWDVDHIVAIANGGKNEETNLQPLLVEHHKAKTKVDVAIKSKSYERRAKHRGIKRKRFSFATNRDGKFKKKMSGKTVRREQ